jgi:hypothetical protein
MNFLQGKKKKKHTLQNERKKTKNKRALSITVCSFSEKEFALPFKKTIKPNKQRTLLFFINFPIHSHMDVQFFIVSCCNEEKKYIPLH